jgi:hypothetical protein
MSKKLMSLSFTFIVICSTLAFAQEKQEGTAQNPAPTKTDTGSKKDAAKEARWEGVVSRTDKDKSTLVVRKVGSSLEKTISYDGSTRWVSQEHGSKKVNDIDATEVKDGDRVIVKGTDEGPARIHAKLISKRLTKH